MQYKNFQACLTLIFIIILSCYKPVFATAYDIDHFSGTTPPPQTALVNRGAFAFVSGDSLNIKNDITATSIVGNIGTTSAFILSVTGNNYTLSGNSLYSGFSIPALSNYTFNTTNLSLFRTATSTIGGAITNAGVLSFTDGNFTTNTAVNGGAIRNTGTQTLTGTITGINPTATSTTTFLNNSATTGNGGAIYTTGSSTITGIKFDSNSSAATGTGTGGGGIYTATGTTTINDSIFTNNSAQRVGGAINQASGTLNITNSLFDNNKSTNITTSTAFGGAIYSGGGTLNLTGTNITNNTVKTTGGGVYTAAATTISGGTFDNNTATIGGGMYNNGSTTISGATFSNNNANTALANSGGGAIYNNSTAISITNSTFSSNHSNISTAVAAYGGAIFNQNGTVSVSGTITGSGSGASSTSTFTGNTAATYGGAIYNNATTAGKTLTVSGTIFDNNSATSGGAVYNNAGTTTFTNDIFKNNQASTSGGAIYNIGTTTVTGSEFISNIATTSGGALYNNAGTVTLLNSDFTNNSAGTSGGAIYNSGTLRIQADGAESLFTGNNVAGVANDLHLAGGTVYLNAGNGGNITFDGAITSTAKANIININTTTGSATLTNGTVNFNGNISTATVNIAAGTTNVGKSSISNVNADNVLFAITGGTQSFTNNTFLNGSRITLNDATPTAGESLSITNGTFNGTGSFVGSGGAINITSGTTHILDTNFSGYSATTSGGAILNGGTTTSTNTDITGTITGTGASATSTTTFSNNTSAGSGGAINNTGTLVLNNIKFNGNSSTSTSTTGGGGAIYQGGVLNINNGIFTNNTTTARGGAIYRTAGATGTVSSGTIFDSNSATGASSSGGAIYTLGSPTFNGVTFNKNYATVNGGAIYVAGSTVTMINDTFTDNGKNGATVETDNGGAIYNDVGNITITDTTFTNNASTLTGGAIRNAVSATNSITLNGATLTGNSSANGGAIYNEGILYIKSGTDVTKLIGNTATQDGGAIYGFGGAGSVSSGTLFDSNTAGRDGGAIYTTSTPNFTGAIFQNNWAERNGGAIYSATTNTSYTDCTFSGNGKSGVDVRTDSGGAIYNANSTMTITGGTFSNNASSVSGGAIYSTITTTGRTFSMSGADFTSNSSLDGGAFYNNAGSATITNTNFTTNTASNNGGAIYIASGTTTLTDCSFTSNAATTSGGAIYIAGGTVNVNATGEAVTFSGNTRGGNANDIAMAGTSILNLTANNFDITLNGGIQGVGTINKLGIGNLIISGTSVNNLFTGTYNNSAGNVQIKSAFFAGTNNFTGGTADIQTGGSLTIKTGGSWTNSAISNNGGTLNLVGLSHTTGTPGTYSQTSGTLNLNNASTLNIGSGSTISSGSVNFSGTGSILNITTGGTFSSDAVLTLDSDNTFRVSGGVATLTNADSWSGLGKVDVTGGNLTLTGLTSNGIYTQSGGTMTLGTPGTLTLGSGSNISAGNVEFSSSGNVLNVAGGNFGSNAVLNLTANNTFRVSGGTATLSNADTWAGKVDVTGGNLTLSSIGPHGIYTQSGGTTTLSSGTLTLTEPSELTGGNLVDNGTLNLSYTEAKTIGTAISGTGIVDKNGSGTLTFTADNSGFSGTFTLSSDGIIIKNKFFNGRNNFTGDPTTADIQSGGSLIFNSGDSWTNTNILNSVGALTLVGFSHTTGTTGIYSQTSGTLNLNNSSTLNIGASSTISSGFVNFSGTGSILNITGGTFGVDTALNLTSNNTFRVSGGTATLGSSTNWSGLGKVDLTSGNLTLIDATGNGIYTQSGGTLNLSNSSGSSSLNLGTGSSISAGNVGFTGTGNLLNISTGASFGSGASLTLNTDNTFRVSGGTATISSADTWSGLGKVDLTGGSLTLTGNTTNGVYTQSGGTLNLNTGTTLTLGTGSTVSAGTVAYTGTGAKTLYVANGGAFNSDCAINISTGNNFNVSGGTATLNGSGTGIDTWTGAVNLTNGNLTLNDFTHDALTGGTYNQSAGTLKLTEGANLKTYVSSIISGNIEVSSTTSTSSNLELVYTGNSTYSTSVDLLGSGTLKLNTGAYTVTNTSGTLITSTGTNNYLTKVGTGTYNFDLSGISGNTQIDYGLNINQGTMNITGPSSGILTFGSDVNLGTSSNSATLNLNAPTGGTITLDDIINSNSLANIVNVNSTGVGTVNFNNNISSTTLNIQGGTTNFGNNITLSNDKLTISGGTANFVNQNFDTSHDITLTGGTININAGNGGSSYINDKIVATAGIVNINKSVGTNPTSGTVYLNKEIDPPDEVNLYNGTLTLSNENYLDGNNFGVYGGNLDSQNSTIRTMALNNLTFGGVGNWLMDVDLANKIGDKITSTNLASGSGSLNISSINLLSDAASKYTSVVVADTNAKNYLTSSVTAVDGALFKYAVAYNSSGSNGVLNFTKTGISPNAMTGDVAQTSTFLMQIAANQQFFDNIDSFMSFPRAQRESTICCSLSNGQVRGSNCPIYANGMFSPIYSCDLNKGVWAKSFVSFEDIPLNNGPSVSTVQYGTLVGGDTPITNLGHGFVGNTSGYVGYVGSNQNYNKVSLSQNGVLVGVGQNVIKGNFFFTGTANVGSSLADANNPWGVDSFSSLFTGAAAKFGYNFEFRNGDYIIQPNLMLSYTFVNTPSYKTASKLAMTSKPFNAVQVAPGIKLIKNLKERKGQVYVTVNYVQNILDNTRFTANDVELPQLSVNPYVEYGIGYQGVWKDRFTGFFQTLFRGGGRNGVALQLGLRWAF